MFFLFFGFGTKVKLRGQAAERTCPRCHNTARWLQLERYRYVSLFFVRLLRWDREQLDACPICGHDEALPVSRRGAVRLSPEPVRG
jgi:endogenous inhibitor of DNA gyrase (YacG/DUF329 family)